MVESIYSIFTTIIENIILESKNKLLIFIKFSHNQISLSAVWQAFCSQKEGSAAFEGAQK